MSFISFKRQLSADLQRMSSHHHGNRTTACPKSASVIRKLGRTAPNPSKPARGIKQGTRNRNRKGESVLEPVPPPPSRRELFPPFCDGRKQCDWTSEGDELLRQNIAENCSNKYLPIGKLRLPDWQNTHHECLKYPLINVRMSRGVLPTRQNVPGQPKVPGFSYPNSGKILRSRRPTAKCQISDWRKEPAIRLVVNLPKPEVTKPFVLFSYKHGKI